MAIKKTLMGIALSAAMALAPTTTKAEEPGYINWKYNNKKEAVAAVSCANVALTCLKSGIGSYMNDRGFWNGCAKGSLAGIVMSAGEYTATFAADKNSHPISGGLGKLTHDMGVSISDNVMRGESMLSQYQTELGPLTLTFKDSITPNLSLTLMPLSAIGSNIILGHKFDIKKSLYYLTPVFKMKGTVSAGKMFADGYSIGNVITYKSNRFHKGNNTISHELNHVLFYSKLRFCGDLLHPIPNMEKIEKAWNIGQEACYGLVNLPMVINNKAYYYQPHEIEANMMERE